MKKILNIKGLKIGEGIPKIAVPIVGVSKEELLEEIQYLKKIKFDIVEWRIDYFENVDNLNKVKEMLSIISDSLKDTPFIVTFRTLKEGGERDISKRSYENLLKELIKTNKIDIVDIELFALEDKAINNLIDIAHQLNVAVIISNHDFDKTPPKNEIIKRLVKMQKLGADLPKIAAMPKNSEDVIEILCATNEMATRHDETPVITVSMGKLGLISRLSGGTFGSAVTFGAAKAISAPGQIQANELYEILKIIENK
jgi:3-dehydroquinate dehydratase-1